MHGKEKNKTPLQVSTARIFKRMAYIMHFLNLSYKDLRDMTHEETTIWQAAAEEIEQRYWKTYTDFWNKALGGKG